jgi:hypothetical protein
MSGRPRNARKEGRAAAGINEAGRSRILTLALRRFGVTDAVHGRDSLAGQTCDAGIDRRVAGA